MSPRLDTLQVSMIADVYEDVRQFRIELVSDVRWRMRFMSVANLRSCYQVGRARAFILRFRHGFSSCFHSL